MQIISLKQNKDKSIYATTDIGLNFRLSLNSIAKFNIFQGKFITETEIREIQKEEKKASIIQSVIELIAIRPRSTKEVAEYIDKVLKRKYEIKEKSNVEIELSNSIIEYLTEKKYIGDHEFTEWWINNRVDFRNLSRKQIKYELLGKGISESIIEENLNNIYPPEDEKGKILKIIEKKYKDIDLQSVGLKEKQKIVSYLLRKGYNYELIKELFN